MIIVAVVVMMMMMMMRFAHGMGGRVGFMARRESLTSRQRLEVLCLTWNVNEQKPEAGSPFFRWLGELGRGAGLACLALQEIEMGGQSVATAAVRDALMRSTQVPQTLNPKP